jgi:hypothetical protein
VDLPGARGALVLRREGQAAALTDELGVALTTHLDRRELGHVEQPRWRERQLRRHEHVPSGSFEAARGDVRGGTSPQCASVACAASSA